MDRIRSAIAFVTVAVTLPLHAHLLIVGLAFVAGLSLGALFTGEVRLKFESVGMSPDK